MIEETKIEKATFSDVLSGMGNAFVDPKGMARQVVKKGFWIWPLAILCVAFVAFGALMAPIIVRVMQLYPPEGVAQLPREQIEKIAHAFAYAPIVAAPVVVVLMLLLSAWLVNLACTVLGIQTKFRHVFSLIMAASMIAIPQLIASYAVVSMKGDDIQSVQELQPAFGLDIFFSGLKGPLLAFLNFFSIFEIWSMVILGLGLAYMARTSKGKAFAAITPAWLIPLLLKVVGSFFQKG